MSFTTLRPAGEVVERFVSGNDLNAITFHDEDGRPARQVIVAIPLGEGLRPIHVLDCEAADWSAKVAALGPWPVLQAFCEDAKRAYDAWRRTAPTEGNA